MEETAVRFLHSNNPPVGSWYLCKEKMYAITDLGLLSVCFEIKPNDERAYVRFTFDGSSTELIKILGGEWSVCDVQIPLHGLSHLFDCWNDHDSYDPYFDEEPDSIDQVISETVIMLENREYSSDLFYNRKDIVIVDNYFIQQITIKCFEKNIGMNNTSAFLTKYLHEDKTTTSYIGGYFFFKINGNTLVPRSRKLTKYDFPFDPPIIAINDIGHKANFKRKDMEAHSLLIAYNKKETFIYKYEPKTEFAVGSCIINNIGDIDRCIKGITKLLNIQDKPVRKLKRTELLRILITAFGEYHTTVYDY